MTQQIIATNVEKNCQIFQLFRIDQKLFKQKNFTETKKQGKFHILFRSKILTSFDYKLLTQIYLSSKRIFSEHLFLPDKIT